MKHLLTLSFLTVLLLAARPSLALWGLAAVSKAEAQKLGIEFRTLPAGPDVVRVEMEFKTDGHLKKFSRVDLRIGEEGKELTAALKEDRSKEGKVVVSFAAARSQIDQINLWIMVPESLGGTAYVIKAKDFVELPKGK